MPVSPTVTEDGNRLIVPLLVPGDKSEGKYSEEVNPSRICHPIKRGLTVHLRQILAYCDKLSSFIAILRQFTIFRML